MPRLSFNLTASSLRQETFFSESNLLIQLTLSLKT